jgi:hypothetical protein
MVACATGSDSSGEPYASTKNSDGSSGVPPSRWRAVGSTSSRSGRNLQPWDDLEAQGVRQGDGSRDYRRVAPVVAQPLYDRAVDLDDVHGETLEVELRPLEAQVASAPPGHDDRSPGSTPRRSWRLSQELTRKHGQRIFAKQDAPTGLPEDLVDRQREAL